LHVPTTTTITTTTTTPATTSTTPVGGAGATTTTTTVPPAQTTSCTSVADLGASPSESLVSNDYIDPPQQLPAQFARVGVSDVNLQISGARSTGPETVDNQPN